MIAPEEIGLLTNLVELNIDNLHLFSLPDSICKLTTSQRLLIHDGTGIAVELPPGLTACRQRSQLRIPSEASSGRP